MARTQIVLDDNLIETALALTELKSRKQLIDHALRELIRRENQKKLLELRGNVTWRGD